MHTYSDNPKEAMIDWPQALVWLRATAEPISTATGLPLDSVVAVGMGFCAMLITFWTYGSLWLLVDVFHKPDGLYSRRAQPKRPFQFQASSYAPSFGSLVVRAATRSLAASATFQYFPIAHAARALRRKTC